MPGFIVHDGLSGLSASPAGHGPTGPVEIGKGLFNTNSFSFVTIDGKGGQQFGDSFEIINTLQRKHSPITYIGIIWSLPDTTTTCTINIRDVANTSLLSLSIGPATIKNVKNICEVYPRQHITTQTSRLIKMTSSLTPDYKTITIYSIMIGFN